MNSQTPLESQMQDALLAVADALAGQPKARLEGYQYVIPFSEMTLAELMCLKDAILDFDRQEVYVRALDEFTDAEFDASQDEMRP